MIASEISSWNLLAIALISIVLGAVILFHIDFKGAQSFAPTQRRGGRYHRHSHHLCNRARGISAMILWFFGRFDGQALDHLHRANRRARAGGHARRIRRKASPTIKMKKKKLEKNWLEWIVFAVGLVLVARTLAYLAYDAATISDAPPSIEVRTGAALSSARTTSSSPSRSSIMETRRLKACRSKSCLKAGRRERARRIRCRLSAAPLHARRLGRFSNRPAHGRADQSARAGIRKALKNIGDG